MPEDERSVWRICGKRIDKGEARYREAEGDVHAECRDRARRPGETE